MRGYPLRLRSQSRRDFGEGDPPPFPSRPEPPSLLCPHPTLTPPTQKKRKTIPPRHNHHHPAILEHPTGPVRPPSLTTRPSSPRPCLLPYHSPPLPPRPPPPPISRPPYPLPGSPPSTPLSPPSTQPPPPPPFVWFSPPPPPSPPAHHTLRARQPPLRAQTPNDTLSTLSPNLLFPPPLHPLPPPLFFVLHSTSPYASKLASSLSGEALPHQGGRGVAFFICERRAASA